MKAMIIAPHMDDETLGMGGTIAKHIDVGDEVLVIIAANRVYGHVYDQKTYEKEKEAVLKAKDILGYQHLNFLDKPDEKLDMCAQDMIISFEKEYFAFKPDVLYTCFYGDNNQDHRAVFDAVRIVARTTCAHKVKRFLLYEVPSSTDQSPPMPQQIFAPNFYVDIESLIEKKVKALKCYEREQRVFPHPRSVEGVKVLAQKRGMEAGFKYAEAFMIMRAEW